MNAPKLARATVRLLDSIPVENVSVGTVDAIQTIERTMAQLGARTPSFDSADALHRLSLALHGLQREAARQRNRTLAKLHAEGVSYGKLAASLSMDRSWLVSLLTKHRTDSAHDD